MNKPMPDGNTLHTARSFYILWNPGSPDTPVRRYQTITQARGVAKTMAEKHPGEEFIIMQARGSAKTPKPKFDLVDYV